MRQAPAIARRGSRGLAAGLLLLALAAAGPPGAHAEEGAAGEPRVFELLPGFVVDRADGCIYAMRPEGGIVAVALDTGAARWQTRRADRPLLVVDRYLLAQREASATPETLDLVLLDRAHPEEGAVARSLRLPEGVRPRVGDARGAAFRIDARRADGAVILAWTWRRVDEGGLAPGSSRARRTRSGFARLDLASRELAPLAPSGVPADPDGGLPASLSGGTGAGGAPWRKGRTIFRTERRVEEGTTHLVVKRWDGRSGAPLADRVLTPPGVLVELVAEDGRHLNVSYRPPGGRPFVDEYLWSIYDLGTGRQVGAVPARASAAPFFVAGTRLVHVSAPYRQGQGAQEVARPLELLGRDLPDGHVAWRLPIRDVRDTGLRPPAGR